MQKTGKGVMELREGLRIYPQLLINVKVSDKKKAMADAEVLAAEEQVNKDLNGNGRILVRASGTEPLVRVMAEAETDAICAEEVGKVVEIVKRKYGI
jgi:phosphoglucosamine mutase